VNVDTAEFRALKDEAPCRPVPFDVLRAYSAGFADGQSRAREEYGLPAVARIRTAAEREAAAMAAEEEAVLRALAGLFRAGRDGDSPAVLPRRHLRVVEGDAS
jgi:hypothetical protein